VLEIAVLDALSLDKSIARVRALLSAVGVGAKLLEVGDHEARLLQIEAAIRVQPPLALDDVADLGA
jgi:hypothetical protein